MMSQFRIGMMMSQLRVGIGISHDESCLEAAVTRPKLMVGQGKAFILDLGTWTVPDPYGQTSDGVWETVANQPVPRC